MGNEWKNKTLDRRKTRELIDTLKEKNPEFHFRNSDFNEIYAKLD